MDSTNKDKTIIQKNRKTILYSALSTIITAVIVYVLTTSLDTRANDHDTLIDVQNEVKGNTEKILDVNEAIDKKVNTETFKREIEVLQQNVEDIKKTQAEIKNDQRRFHDEVSSDIKQILKELK